MKVKEAWSQEIVMAHIKQRLNIQVKEPYELNFKRPCPCRAFCKRRETYLSAIWISHSKAKNIRKLRFAATALCVCSSIIFWGLSVIL